MTSRRLAQYDVLVLVSLIWFLGKFVRYVFPPLFERLQLTYGVSNAAIGSAFTGFMIVYALMQFPSGVVADRLGSVRVVSGGAAVAGCGALTLVVDSPFPVLVGAMLVIGAGTGVHKTVAVRLITHTYPARKGRVLGIHDTLGAFGGVVAPAAVVAFLSAPRALARLLDGLPSADWRGIFLLTGVAALGLTVAFGLRFRGQLSDANGRSDGERSEPEPGLVTYLALFREWRFSAFVFVIIGVSFVHNGLVAFLPLYLSQVSDLTATTASLLYSVFFWVTFVQLVTGEFSDRLGRLPLMVATSGIATIAISGIVLAPEARTVTLGVLIAVVGVGAHGFNPVRGAYLMELLPRRVSGGGLGAVRSLLMGVSALAPGAVGVITDVADFRVAFGILAVVIALSTIGVAGLWLTEP